MSYFALDAEIAFPPVELAGPDGLLAYGGDLEPERLLLAYRNGIFPWYSEPPILWWCPDPRFVLFPAELEVSKSMKKLIRKNHFHFTFNKDFNQVIHCCKTVYRPTQDGTWITNELEAAFVTLHQHGYAQSGEAWHNDQLVGGIYGLRIGNIFFAESMFSLETNASEFALINFVQHLENDGVLLIDCQVFSPHLQSLGARMISRKSFTTYLHQHC